MSGVDRTEMSEDEERPTPSDLGGVVAKPRNSTTTATPASTIQGDLGCYISPNPDQVLENVLENVLCFLTSRRDRNAASLVCKSWFRAEALTRSEVFIGNCYAVSPGRVINRFKRVNSVSIKGKPRFADFSLLPRDWGAYFAPWVNSMAEAYRGLERVYLKRMSITDEDLAVLAHSFPNFKELILVCCEGFGTNGLAIVATECRLAVFSSFLLFLRQNGYLDLPFLFFFLLFLFCRGYLNGVWLIFRLKIQFCKIDLGSLSHRFHIVCGLWV